jgi:hypothetical protein
MCHREKSTFITYTLLSLENKTRKINIQTAQTVKNKAALLLHKELETV